MARTYKTVTKKMSRLTPAERSQCMRMGYRNCGMMRGEIEDSFEKSPDKSRIVMVKDADNNVRAAAFINHNFDPVRPEVYYWTQHRYRRRGLGAFAARAVKRLLGDRYDHYPDENPGFFKAIGALRRIDLI